MSGRRITELTVGGDVAPDDLLVTVDISGTPTTKRVTARQLVDGVPALREPNVRTANYTLTLSDADAAVEMDLAGANTVTVPPDSAVAYPVGTTILVTQVGAGQTTVVAGSGVTVDAPYGLAFPDQWVTGILRKRDTDEWVFDVVTSEATSKASIETDDGDLQLVGDEDAPGNDKVYGTDGTGTKGWKDDPVDVVAPNVQTADYTLVADDAGKAVEMDVAGANDLTVPPNSSVAFDVGTVIEVTQVGAGQTTVVAGSGVTIQTPGTLVLAGQWSSVSLRKRATDEWVLAGDTT